MSAGATVSPQPPAFMLALVEAVVPGDEVPLPIEAKAEVVAATAVFVAGQIASLPGTLRVLFRLGTFGFRMLAAVRYLGAFTALPMAKRRQYVEAWAWGPIALARQFLRAVRGTALLAYYDHPHVIAAMNGRRRLTPLRHLESA